MSQGLDNYETTGRDTGTFLIDSTLATNPIEDSLTLDSLAQDSLAQDTTPPKRKSTLDYEVTYEAEDSMLIDLEHEKVYLYGNAIAEYGDIKLEADFIEISLATSELHATGLPDSTGKMAGQPIFHQGDQNFDAGEMRYNFKTQRGLSKKVITQEAEGFLHGEVVKKDTGNVIYISEGKYTTCDYVEPHFHIHAKRLKVITQDKIITGPAYLSIADIPTPLVVPFGYFPNSESRSNGIIIPSYDQTKGLGFSLNGGGYYFGIGDRADFALRADVYTRGSWSGYVDSQYAKRYRHSGNVGLEVIKRVYSEPEFPDYNSSPIAHRVVWNHKEDPKAKPGRSFSAAVDFGTPNSQRLNVQSSASNYTRASVKSNIRYTKSFANTPFTFSAAAAGNQNPSSEQVNLQVPDAALTMTRIYPLKRKELIGEEKPWEKVGISADLSAKNQVTAPYSKMFTDSTFNEMKNGAQLNVPIQGYKVFRYVTMTPSVTNRFVGVRQTTEGIQLDSAVDETRINKANGFWEGSAGLNFSTVIYGIYQYKSDVIRAMRHQMTPAAGISYKPDYSDPNWGYYQTIQGDSLGNELQYSIFEGGVYGTPGAQENGVLNFSLQNTFELKVRDLKDTTDKATGEKKLKLLDAFGFSTAYNLSKDSLKWSPLSISVRTSVVPGFTFNGSASLNPYAMDPTTGKFYDVFLFEKNGKIGRWTAAQGALSYRITPKQSKAMVEQKRERLSEQGFYYDDFVDFEVPWSANITYNIRYARSGLKETVTQNLDFNGDINITQNWKIGVRTSYDITNQDFGYTNFDIYRNLHCWEMRLGVTPFGQRQQYNFAINVKASTLQDLKLNRDRQFSVPQR
ncbi:MAG: putative LPS assembly protein LptD [Flavobacteriales bacterium]